jgi:SAM-dependent methyltransferase
MAGNSSEQDIQQSSSVDTEVASNCRFCGTKLEQSFINLGTSPLCQSHVSEDALALPEPYLPLHAFVCDRCWLVQLGQFATPDEIFGFYHYFSSFSDSWLRHAERYVGMVTDRFGLGTDSQVVEIASNDGYLLQNFVQRGIPCFGIEPAANVAEAAKEKGVDSVVAFFGQKTASRILQERGPATLLLGNNVLAHVPDLNDFVAGMKVLLAPDGVITMEFPHLVRLIDELQFDTIYHEHFSYFSFTTVEQVFAQHGLTLFDVEELPSHGGSLRIYACHTGSNAHVITRNVDHLRQHEKELGVSTLDYYRGFEKLCLGVKRDLLRFLIDAAEQGKLVAGYGAPGKGNTLLNFCGIRPDLLSFTVDRNPLKQGTWLPGSRVPVFGPDEIFARKPDYVLILPWNLTDEIVSQMSDIRDWGGQFVRPIPKLEVL